MKFENVGKWMKEAEEDKLVFDNREPADFLDGDDEICTLKTEDDESDYDDDDFSGELLDEVESDEDELESPDNEEDAIIMADESSQKNEDNISELKKELNLLYRGIGWAEWDYFKEGLAYSTNFKPNGMLDNDLEKMINASGIAKVKKVKEIKNYSSMQDFDPKDFRQDDKIIVTKEPMSSKFYGESSQKNEALDREKAMELIGSWKSSLMGDNGDFEMHLAKACQHADKNNLMKLEKVFPQLLQKFCAWKSSGKTDRVAQL